ncbi:MAG: type III pantothenate kinase [Gammaproteobacteria bacterium]|nr:type III pantothenate kinase [Gammaproteobacteria bacterium]
MILVIDVGNSCLKWGQVENGQLTNCSRVNIREHDLNSVFATHWSLLPEPNKVVLSTVAPEMGASVLAWCEANWSCPTLLVKARQQAGGISNAYVEPGRLGSDRWAAMVAAYHRFQIDTCVIDSGTALTLDIINGSGKHLGGYIVPGLYSMLQSLNQETAGIQADIQLEKDADTVTPGTSTVQAIARGAILSAVGLIEQAIKNYREQNGIELRCVITGGDAEQLIPYLSSQVQHEPWLVLDGLVILASE